MLSDFDDTHLCSDALVCEYSRPDKCINGECVRSFDARQCESGTWVVVAKDDEFCETLDWLEKKNYLFVGVCMCVCVRVWMFFLPPKSQPKKKNK